MGVPYSETDKVAKLMDGKSSIRELLGLKIAGIEKKLQNPDLNAEDRKDLEKKLADQKSKRNAEFIAVYENNEELHRVIDMGLKLEGTPKNTSEHAAGVVICRKVLSDNVPLARNGDDIVTQFDMKEVEAVGMLKMDFLALTTLTDMQNTLQYIKENYGIDIDFHEIGYDVPEAYQLISSGDTDAVFQLEQGGHEKVHERFAAELPRRFNRRHFAVSPRSHGLYSEIHSEQAPPRRDCVRYALPRAYLKKFDTALSCIRNR